MEVSLVFTPHLRVTPSPPGKRTLTSLRQITQITDRLTPKPCCIIEAVHVSLAGVAMILVSKFALFKSPLFITDI